MIHIVNHIKNIGLQLKQCVIQYRGFKMPMEVSHMTTTQKLNTRDMVRIALFAVVIAICSWLSIPAAVPFTLQTFGVFLTVAVLGGKRGSLSVFLYLLMGTIGLPVFSGFSGGVGKLLGATGGYILGFLFSALVMWGMEALLGKKRWVLALSMLAGLIVCYAFGTFWFVIVYARSSGSIGLVTALGWCVFPYIIPDLIKIALAMLLSKKLSAYFSVS